MEDIVKNKIDTLQAIRALAFLGIFNSVLAYLAWNSALVRIGPIKTGVIYYLQPLFSILGSMIFFNTFISPIQTLGGGIIILGIYLSNQKQKNGG